MTSCKGKNLHQLIQDYLQDGKSAEVDDVVHHLRGTYMEYKRKKVDALRAAVAKCMDLQ